MTDIKEAQGLEVVGYFFQHEESGQVMIVDTQQVEWGFEKNNPWLVNMGAMCRLSDATAVIDQLRERVAELEAKWRTEHDTANAHIMAHDAVRAELDALKSAPVGMPDDKAIEQVMADVCEENKEFEIRVPYYALCVHEFKEVLARLNRSKT